jgi:hypothetical protein
MNKCIKDLSEAGKDWNYRVSFERPGGYAAISVGLLFALVLVIFLVVLPALGATAVADLRDPAKVLPVLAQQPLVCTMALVDLPLGLSLLFVVLGVGNTLRIGAARLASLAQLSGIATVAILLNISITSCVGLRRLGDVYTENPTGAEAAYLAFHATIEGWVSIGVLGLVCWLVLVCCAGFRSGILSKPLCCAGLVVAVVHVGRLFFTMPPVLDIIWFPWLGVMLLKQSPSRERPR